MPEYLIGSGLPNLPAGLTDKDAALVTPLYRAIANLAQQLSVLTGSVQYSGAERAIIDQFVGLVDAKEQKLIVLAGAALAYGQLLTLGISGGRLSATVADASNLAKPAHAVCNVPGGIASGTYGEAILLRGRTAGITGTTLGATYYLSTAGAVQLTAPTADSVLNQIVGIGLGSAGFYLNVEQVGRRVSRAYKTTAANMRIQYTDGSFDDLPV